MKEVKIGAVVNINGSIGTILKIQDGLALIKWFDGGQTCYGVNGIKQNQIVSDISQLTIFQRNP